MGLRFGRPCFGIAMLLAAVAATAQPSAFPRPAGLEPDIEFWRRVYTEVDTSSGFIHDSGNLGVVYRTVRFPEEITRRERNRRLRAAYDEIRGALERLATGKRDGLTGLERRVLDAWPTDVTNAQLKAGMSRLRFQLGQSDRFRSGLIRAGTWKPYIESILRRENLPLELAALPHVESSFDPTAYSKVGAAGMWQFTRSTGLRYMRIDHVVDERRDPFFATVAAARLLKNNFAVLGTWPLALTAYNHGVAGMRRAVQQQETDDIETIARQYSGRTFGFASRNFYVAFLAALDIDRDPESYFGPLQPSPPAQSVTVSVPDFLPAQTLVDTFGLDLAELRHWNPALTDAVWNGDKFVPRGFELRLPTRLDADPEVQLAAIPASLRFASQTPDVIHRVRGGETISGIATRYGVSIASLVNLNGLRSRNFIRAGQVLRLPGSSEARPVTLAAAADSIDGATSTYVVRAGDSIQRIAQRFGVAEATLLALNGIADRDRIYAGQALKIDANAVDVASENEFFDVEPTLAAATIDTASAVDRVDRITALAEISTRSRTDEQRLLVAEAALATIMNTGIEVESESSEAANPFAEDVALGESMGVEAAVLDAIETDAANGLSGDMNALGSEQAELAADPSDYLVAEDETIEVHALETLGHYADWLGIPTQRLRDVNGLPFGQAVVIGTRLRLEFGVVDKESFERRRVEYQRSAQEEFFNAYQITETVEHVIRPGESLWVLAQRHYRVPVWLVRQFNPDLNLDRVNPGTVVKFPALQAIAEPEPATQAAN